MNIRRQYEQEHPERIGETDKDFAESLYMEWLEAKVIAVQNDVSGNEAQQKENKKESEVAVAFADYFTEYLLGRFDSKHWLSEIPETKIMYERFIHSNKYQSLIGKSN